MLTDNNQIFRNSFVIIYCHLTKVSSQINKCIIFKPNELYNTIYSRVSLLDTEVCTECIIDVSLNSAIGRHRGVY